MLTYESLKKYIDMMPRSHGVNESDHMHNVILQATAKTKYKVNDKVKLDSGEIVIISMVQPVGYISISASKSYYSARMLPPVVNDCVIYQYKRLTDSAKGQTTEEKLFPILN